MSSGYEWNIPKKGNILFVPGSVTNEIDLKRVFFEKPVIVFHLAAFFANQNSVDYPEKDFLVFYFFYFCPFNQKNEKTNIRQPSS